MSDKAEIKATGTLHIVTDPTGESIRFCTDSGKLTSFVLFIEGKKFNISDDVVRHEGVSVEISIKIP